MIPSICDGKLIHKSKLSIAYLRVVIQETHTQCKTANFSRLQT